MASFDTVADLVRQAEAARDVLGAAAGQRWRIADDAQDLSERLSAAIDAVRACGAHLPPNGPTSDVDLQVALSQIDRVRDMVENLRRPLH